jgi:hypothetical protein
MGRMLAGAAVAAGLGLCACEGMAPGGYGDMPEDPNIAAAQAAAARSAMPQQPQIPMPPRPMSLPNGQPAPGAIPQVVIPKPPTAPAPITGGPSRTPAPPAAPAPAPTTGGPSKVTPPPVAPAPPPTRAGCSAPNVSIRTEITGAVEIKCGPSPAPVPTGMTCKPGEQLTYLTRNGASSYQCMK